MHAFATEVGEGRQFRSAFALVQFDGRKPGDRERQQKLWEAKPVLVETESFKLQVRGRRDLGGGARALLVAPAYRGVTVKSGSSPCTLS